MFALRSPCSECGFTAHSAFATWSGPNLNIGPTSVIRLRQLCGRAAKAALTHYRKACRKDSPSSRHFWIDLTQCSEMACIKLQAVDRIPSDVRIAFPVIAMWPHRSLGFGDMLRPESEHRCAPAYSASVDLRT